MNNAVLIICEQGFECIIYVFISLGYISRSAIARWFLRSYQTLLHSSCSILYSHQQYMRVSVSLYPHQRLLSSVFLTVAILVVVKWCLMVLSYFSMMSNDVEHLFMCLLAIGRSSLEKCLFIAFAQFLIVLSFSCWVVGVLNIFPTLVPYHDLQIFSPILWVIISHY